HTLLEWNNIDLDFAPNWQAYLWKAIQIKTSDLQWSDKNQISQFILQSLKEGINNDKIKAQLPVINVFGLSIFTRYHLEIWFKLSEIVDIHFYLLNPAPNIYWGDDKNEKEVIKWQSKYGAINNYNIGNDLLTNWGKLMQQTMQLLFLNEEALNAYEIL